MFFRMHLFENMRNDSEDAIRRTAYVIWQERTRLNEPDVNDEIKNWFLAKKRLNVDE
jgi:hypothetical protein